MVTTQPSLLGARCTFMRYVPPMFSHITDRNTAHFRRAPSVAALHARFPKPQVGGSSPLGGTSVFAGCTLGSPILVNLGPVGGFNGRATRDKPTH